MAVFRVEKVKDYTIMSNHHLRNVDLSLKAKGLMSLMLSLPEDWDYTLKGLACICRDGVDSISRTIKELEDHGYLTRRRFRYPNGRLGDIEYDILVERYGAERLDAVVELMLEAVVSQSPYCMIAGGELPREVVRARLLNINSAHIEYIFDCLDENTSKVGNIKAYVLATLFNAPATMDEYYRAEVNHDYPTHGRRKAP